MNGFNLSNITDLYVGSAPASAIYYGSNMLWSRTHDYSKDYFTIESLEDSNTVTLNYIGAVNSIGVYVSTNNGSTYNIYNWGTGSTSPSFSLNTGDKLIIYNSDNLNLNGSDTVYRYISSTKTFKVYGNINSIYFSNINTTTNITTDYLFCKLFKDSNVVDASNLILPSTTISEHCYDNMFYNCSSLVNGPIELPSTTLNYHCYYQMFMKCSSLLESPILPAAILKQYCYYSMFAQCSSITKVTCFATNINATDCTAYWLSGAAASATFVKDSSMGSWPSGSSGIPSGWTTISE